MSKYKAFIKGGIVQGIFICDDIFVPVLQQQYHSDQVVDVTNLEQRPSPNDLYDGVKFNPNPAPHEIPELDRITLLEQKVASLLGQQPAVNAVKI